jgi:flagellar biogenesis protein FliO
MHRKYALGATKRLRVAETVSLGEKRFVALVRVEDCEFLIGGGASGVSLLTQLGTVPGADKALRSELGVEGDSV